MNQFTTLLAACALALAMPAFGQAQKAPDTKAAEAKPTNSQQDKMKMCNEKAADKKGDERKAFMKTCLSASPAPMTQGEKMSMCNKKTAGLKGDERSKAQSECMKGAS
jgi:hypothetical protein